MVEIFICTCSLILSVNQGYLDSWGGRTAIFDSNSLDCGWEGNEGTVSVHLRALLPVLWGNRIQYDKVQETFTTETGKGLIRESEVHPCATSAKSLIFFKRGRMPWRGDSNKQKVSNLALRHWRNAASQSK